MQKFHYYYKLRNDLYKTHSFIPITELYHVIEDSRRIENEVEFGALYACKSLYTSFEDFKYRSVGVANCFLFIERTSSRYCHLLPHQS